MNQTIEGTRGDNPVSLQHSCSEMLYLFQMCLWVLHTMIINN